MTMLMLRILFWSSGLLVCALVIVPIGRFLLYQWAPRKLEFENRFSEESLGKYLGRFYKLPDTKKNLTNIQRFDYLYNRMAGRHLYIFPTLLLAVILALMSILVIETALRTGYENYVRFYGATTGGEAVAVVSRLTVAQLDNVVLPAPAIVLSAQALAAIAGAYLYVFGVVLRGFRTRTLTSSDIFWCCFRLVIAVPMAIGLGALAAEALGPFIAFALGAFPMESITRLMRRLLAKTLKEELEKDSDQLVRLAGITSEVAAILSEEGVGAAQQLACMDPVAIAVRTGLPFDYILDLVSQSQAWRYLGASAGDLLKVGLGNALSIKRLVDRLSDPADGEASTVLAASATLLQIDQAVLRSVFDDIAADPYTGFLYDIAR